MDPKSEVDYLRKLEDATENIRKAFAAQEAQAVVSAGYYATVAYLTPLPGSVGSRQI